MSKMPRGFTLLEVMLAIAIFSTLSFLASMVFSQASEQHQRAKKTADNFDAIQHTMLLFENDLMQYVPRKNRQTNQPFFSEKDGAIFTTQTRDPAMPFEVVFILTTVHWYVDNGTLYRAMRRSPDGKEEAPPQALLSDIAHLSATMALAEGDSASTTAKITLERENGEILTRLFILPGWFPEKQKSSPTSGAATGTAK